MNPTRRFFASINPTFSHQSTSIVTLQSCIPTHTIPHCNRHQLRPQFTQFSTTPTSQNRSRSTTSTNSPSLFSKLLGSNSNQDQSNNSLSTRRERDLGRGGSISPRGRKLTLDEQRQREDEEEQERIHQRNMETATAALERTLRGRSMAGMASTMDCRLTTLDETGKVTTTATHVNKSELCSTYRIQPRDLRKLDSAVPTVVPTILSRKSCIILTMLHLRVVITAKNMTIFDSVGSEDSWLKGVFIWSAEHALKSTGSSSHSAGLPYEFKALEAALTSIVAALENDLANIRSHVVELLSIMENHIDRDNLRLMLQYSRKLSIFQKRAALVQEALDELLSNDDDLAAMYLTCKLQGHPRSPDDHEEIELLLESFSKQCEEIVSEVETLAANVRHTEDIIELILDANRNSLLGLDLRVSIATLGVTCGALIAALFGMNLTSHLESTPYSFGTVTILAFALSGLITGFGLRRLRTLRKVNLGWREELRAAGDRWAARKRSRRRD